MPAVVLAGKLRDSAIVCGTPLVSGSAVVREKAIIEDYAVVVAGEVYGQARLSGNAAIFQNPESKYAPKISGNARVMGSIGGRVVIDGNTVVTPGQEINNPTSSLPAKTMAGISSRGDETAGALKGYTVAFAAARTGNIVLVSSAVQSIQYKNDAPDLSEHKKQRHEPQR